MSKNLSRFALPAIVCTALLWSSGGALIKLVDLSPLAVALTELESGRLTDLLPNWRPGVQTAHLVFASHRGMLPSVRALIDFLVEEFRELKDD